MGRPVRTVVALAAAGVLCFGAPTAASGQVSPASDNPSAEAAPPDPAGAVRAAQMTVVQDDHRGPIDRARASVGADNNALASARQAAAAAAAAEAADSAAVQSAQVKDSTAHVRRYVATVAATLAARTLAGDHTRLGALAVLMYTGEPSNLVPTTLVDLEDQQGTVLAVGQVEALAAAVDGHLHADLLAARRTASDKVRADAASLAADATLASDTSRARFDADLDAAAQQQLAAAQSRLARDSAVLAAAESSLSADLASLVVPAGSAGVPILGPSVLSAKQLAGWFRYEGYDDLTSAPIDQLAGWYSAAGAALGVRGDVAFAQAVLETGGFSSPDSVNLSNFAGIGHCDTCSAGWTFPSPQGGVVGQVQLLRIFADATGPPPGAPPPVLPQLTTANEFERGCCSTWESLTGVWATDPLYGHSILDIYQQMLAWAAGQRD